MIYCDFHAIDPTGRRTDDDLVFTGQRRRTPELARGPLSALLFWCYGCLPGNLSAVMLRKEVWAQAGGFPAGQQAPDYDLFTRIALAHDVGFLRDKLIEVRDHPLQLGRLGPRQMVGIAEERAIKARLKEALAGVLTEAQLERSWRSHRGRQHMHWIARALLSGDVAAASRGWQALRGYGAPWRQALAWFTSANGRLFTASPNALFDAAAPRCVGG
jgi:hypothetical protein